jgi:putative transposase
MAEDRSSQLGNVITIDGRIKSHLDRLVQGTAEEKLNALLDAEADRLCNAQRYERRGGATGTTEPAIMGAGCRPRLVRCS